MYDRICATRHLFAMLWLAVFSLGAMSAVLDAPEFAGLSLLGFVFVALLTLSLGKLEAEESLAWPLAYRVIVGAWFGLALCGALLGLVPGSSEASRFFGVYFGVVAVLAYRAILARGPRHAVNAAVISVLLWFPMLVFLMRGERGMEGATHWSEPTTLVMLQVFMLVLPIIGATTVVAFKPRQITIPAARALR
jgi:hypothetical protein